MLVQHCHTYMQPLRVPMILSIYAAQVAELNGLIGGATVADLTAMSSEVFASISTTGIKNLPAATVNSLPASHLSSATTTQLAALLSSPYVFIVGLVE